MFEPDSIRDQDNLKLRNFLSRPAVAKEAHSSQCNSVRLLQPYGCHGPWKIASMPSQRRQARQLCAGNLFQGVHRLCPFQKLQGGATILVSVSFLLAYRLVGDLIYLGLASRGTILITPTGITVWKQRHASRTRLNVHNGFPALGHDSTVIKAI